MNDLISPRFQMKLVKEVNQAIWDEFKSYKDVEAYIEKWHVEQDEWNHHWENFEVKRKTTGDIDLLATLFNIDGLTLLKVAVDIGVETPDFIPSVATFRNEIKSSYETASATFDKAFKNIEQDPDIAIGLANSALESIIKEILKDDRIKAVGKRGDTLYMLATHILKEFALFPNNSLPPEIKTLGSSLLSACQAIEGIRSNSSRFHGKTNDDYLVDDSIYAYFVVNSVSTIGLFIKTYYNFKLPASNIHISSDDEDLPF